MPTTPQTRPSEDASGPEFVSDELGPDETSLNSSREPRFRRLSESLVTPIVAGVSVAFVGDLPYEGALLTMLVFLCANAVVAPPAPWVDLLPFMKYPLRAVPALVGVAGVAIMQAVIGLPGVGPLDLLLLLLTTSVAAMITTQGPRRRWNMEGPVRTAVIGSARTTSDLAGELEAGNIGGYTVVGRVAIDASSARDGLDAPLGELADLREIIERHDVALLVMAAEAPRFLVFDEIARSCLHLPVRLWELSGFYEDVFGHVPVADINVAWFQYIMHPNYRAIGPAAKRAIDVAVAGVATVFFLPLLALLALLIKRDGGPVLFKQVRIGEGGRPLTVYKLRTMRSGPSEAAAQWSGADDPRVTRIGRILRRTHLDEFPQLFNVLKGEMSLVGPRPEQPEFVDRLETLVAFYQRRHLVKPGITGWAQVRCGYAGSDVGSAWKVSHDLYYIKHRSLGFDMAILAETLRTFFFDRQYAVEPPGVSFILAEAAAGRDPNARLVAAGGGQSPLAERAAE